MKKILISALIPAIITVSFNMTTAEERHLYHWKEAMTAAMAVLIAEKNRDCTSYLEFLEIYRSNAKLMGAWGRDSDEKVLGKSEDECRIAELVRSLRKVQ